MIELINVRNLVMVGSLKSNSIRINTLKKEEGISNV
jgi:hypothetical protein